MTLGEQGGITRVRCGQGGPRRRLTSRFEGNRGAGGSRTEEARPAALVEDVLARARGSQATTGEGRSGSGRPPGPLQVDEFGAQTPCIR